MIRVVGVACVALACAGMVSAQPKAAAGSGQKKPGFVFKSNDAAVAGAQGFSVVLVLGDLQSGPTADNIPQAARKALADMKDFLPYRSYRLLDAAWILGSHNLVARLRGPDDQEYSLNLTAGPSRDDPKPLYLTFQLRDADTPKPFMAAVGDAPAREKQFKDVMTRRAAIEQQLRDAEAVHNEKHPDVIRLKTEIEHMRQQIAELDGERRADVKRPGSCCIISTGFTMDVGETVVVGTSRLRGGDKALIALLTAVARTK